MDYFAPGPRLILRVIDEAIPQAPGTPGLVQPGDVGRVLAHRLDETCMLVNLIERDHATRTRASPSARALGWDGDGVRDPHVPVALASSVRTGVY